MSQADNNAQNAQGQDQNSGYFDLHATGVGYLNRPRTVTPRKGEKFLACSISAMRGSADDVEYTKFDLRVSGGAAKEDIKFLESEVNANKAVIIGFKLGDFYPDAFVYEKGDKKGETGVVLKGRLLKVTFAKVDGKAVELPSMQKAAATGTDGQ